MWIYSIYISKDRQPMVTLPISQAEAKAERRKRQFNTRKSRENIKPAALFSKHQVPSK
jgi:hypothetical protein